MPPEREYESLLESVADGAPIDWAALDASAATSADRSRYRNLRLVARVAELHRTLVLDDGESAVASIEAVTTADPATWGHLSIRAQVASGSFGRIYRAHDSQLNRDVALKLMRGDITQSQPIERLLSEARTLARVHHPNVVTVHGADVRGGRAGLWMELVDGQTLDSWVRSHGSMGGGEASSIGVDLCRALAAVHAAGLVHGDVKAQNVMREKGGRIVLMDFGAGRAQGAAAIGVAGTPMYLAAEVLAGEPPTTHSDLYSLGVLLFYLLTGTFPYSAVDLESLRAAHADDDRRWLRDLRPELPRELVQAIERAIEPDPARRFATAGQMERALVSNLRQIVPLDVEPVVWSKHSTRRWFALTALVLLTVVVGLIAWSRFAAVNRGTVLTGIRTVGVLPMADPTGTGLSADFAAGLTDELASALGQVHALTVKSGPLLESLEGKSDKEIAQSLDVDALLRTTVTSSGESNGQPPPVKVQARLVAAGTQGIVWSQDFERQRGDTGALASAIAAAVTRAVKATFSAEESSRLASVHQTSPAAEEAYLAGRAYIESYGGGKAEDARKAFQRALALDGDYARAHAGMARAYISLAANEVMSNAQARPQALAEARRAVDLDPNLAEAHTVLAHIYSIYDWDWASAEREFKRSLDLNPNSEYALVYYSNFLAAQGRLDESLKQAETARRLDPQSGAAARNHVMVLYYQKDYPAAEQALQESAAIESNQVGLPLWRARLAEARGDFDGALADTREALKLSKGPVVPLTVAAIRLEALAGHRSDALASLAALQRDTESRKVPLSARNLAYIQLAFGDKTKALELFEEAVSERDPTVIYLGVDPRADGLRGDPRFRQLITAMGLPAALGEPR